MAGGAYDPSRACVSGSLLFEKQLGLAEVIETLRCACSHIFHGPLQGKRTAATIVNSGLFDNDIPLALDNIARNFTYACFSGVHCHGRTFESIESVYVSELVCARANAQMRPKDYGGVASPRGRQKVRIRGFDGSAGRFRLTSTFPAVTVGSTGRCWTFVQLTPAAWTTSSFASVLLQACERLFLPRV